MTPKDIRVNLIGDAEVLTNKLKFVLSKLQEHDLSSSQMLEIDIMQTKLVEVIDILKPLQEELVVERNEDKEGVIYRGS